MGQYETWINFRQNHQCCSSIPNSVGQISVALFVYYELYNRIAGELPPKIDEMICDVSSIDKLMSLENVHRKSQWILTEHNLYLGLIPEENCFIV